jgi:hypothetical protein
MPVRSVSSVWLSPSHSSIANEGRNTALVLEHAGLAGSRPIENCMAEGWGRVEDTVRLDDGDAPLRKSPTCSVKEGTGSVAAKLGTGHSRSPRSRRSRYVDRCPTEAA